MKPSVELGDPVALLFYKNIILRCILIIHKIKKPQGREMFNCSTLGWCIFTEHMCFYLSINQWCIIADINYKVYLNIAVV